MSGIWKLYTRPSNNGEGQTVEGLRGMGEVKYYTGNENFGRNSTVGFWFNFKMALCYGFGLWSYVYCTRNGIKAQRWLSSLILTAVPCTYLLIRHGEDVPVGHSRRLSLEERLTFYPVTRRALERAVEEVLNEPKPSNN
mmetsp:Transcript_17136/g.17027  ORF Transcript_17136/g.17027 Transcript_17136/m.17027 type:complete len:139 (+) Transcript_17136:4-420(+)